MRVKLTMAVVGLLIALAGSAQAKGIVDDKVRFILSQGDVKVPAGQFTAIKLPSGMDKFEVSIDVHNKHYNDVDAFVCDEQSVLRLKARQSVRCPGVSRGRGHFNFSAPGNLRQPYLVINNGFSMILTKKVSYSIAVVDHLDNATRQKLLHMADGISTLIQKTFEVPEFNIAIRPCGQVNAFSREDTGDITVCSELMFQELRKGRKGALEGIIFHEIGHSLLGLWNIPGNSNEELVDEFAVVMMFISGDQGIAYQLADYFSEANAQREAVMKIYQDDRHPLSPQRVRNVKKILNNPAPVVERWNQILYLRMTIDGLRDVLQTSPKFANKALADKLIAQKSGGAKTSTTASSPWAPPPQEQAPPPQKVAN